MSTRLLALSIIAAIALAVAGCGGGTETPDATGDPDTVAAMNDFWDQAEDFGNYGTYCSDYDRAGIGEATGGLLFIFALLGSDNGAELSIPVSMTSTGEFDRLFNTDDTVAVRRAITSVTRARLDAAIDAGRC